MSKSSRLFFSFLLATSFPTIQLLAQDNQSSLKDPETFKLTGIIWGASEIGIKSCKATGESIPKSMDTWYKSLSDYAQAENLRDDKLNSAILALKKKMADLTAGKSNQELQVAALQFQIDSTKLNIESIGGENGRIPLRENLLNVVKKSLENNTSEDNKFNIAFKTNLKQNGFEAAISSAKRACERKKITKTCGEGSESSNCTETETKNPVPGCDVALKSIPKIQSGPAKEYQDLYLLKKLPSKEYNEKFQKLELAMTDANNAIPKSNDSGYDWTTPVANGIKKMTEVRKSSGIKCPNNADKKVEDKTEIATKARTYLEALGISQDELTKDIDSFSEEWNQADQVIGQSGQRAQYFEKIEKLLKGLIEADKAKLVVLQSQLSKLQNNGKEVQSSFTAGNNITSSDLSDYVKNHPDFVGLEKDSSGQTVAKMKKPDGTIYYVDPSFDGKPVTAESCGPSPVPVGAACFFNVDYSNSSTFCNPSSPAGKVFAEWNKCIGLARATNAIQCIPERVGSIIVKACPTPGGPSVSAAPKAAKDPCTPDYPGGPVIGPCPATGPSANASAKPATTGKPATPTTKPVVKIDPKKDPNSQENQKTNFQKQFAKGDKTKRLDINTECNSIFPNAPASFACPSAKPNPLCEPQSKERIAFNKRNGCVDALTEHNAKVDAQINLSPYVKSHPDYVEIVKSPDDPNQFLAKMKNPEGMVYYLPLNYTPPKEEKK